MWGAATLAENKRRATGTPMWRLGKGPRMVTITITAETPEEAAESVRALARVDEATASDVLGYVIDGLTADLGTESKSDSKATRGNA